MNSNSMPSTFWLFWELFRNPDLLRQALTEATVCLTDPSSQTLEFDIPKLCNQALLKSCYAETLRMRVAVYLIRKSEYQDAHIKEYIVPKEKMIVISSHTAHMDKSNWNTGDNDSHPVDEFWAKRFLTYRRPNCKPSSSVGEEETSTTTDKSKHGPVFSLNGYSGAWIPFGGGIHQRPGRHWVKLQMLLSFAMMCTAFEIELTNGGKDPGMDGRKYGLGALQPKRETPFRIRRRTS